MRARHHRRNENRSLLRYASTPTRLLFAALSAIALTLAVPAPASAQPALWATSPENGAALDLAPGEIAATFSTTLAGASTTLTVTGPDQTAIDLEQPRYSDNVLIQPMRYTAPGDYTVTINAAFEDGEVLESSFSFSIESIPDMLAAEHTTSTTGDGSAAEASTTATTDQSDSNTTALGVALLAAVVLAVGGILMVRRRKQRRREPQPQNAPHA